MLFALGFVFLFTIGGLINHLALPLNTTICWELLIIILLLGFCFISVTMYNFEQSAGNQKIEPSILVGTSETKRSPRFITREDLVHVIKINFLNPYSRVSQTATRAGRHVSPAAKKYI